MYLKNILQSLYRRFVIKRNSNAIKDKNITLLCNNCLGGGIYVMIIQCVLIRLQLM
mgnify:CR=1 FL=1